MEDYKSDKRVVLTLDAGGTNFVFSAIQSGKLIVRPIQKPANGHDLDLCLAGIVSGFNEVKEQLQAEPVAISFAFPGPADYNTGIIGDLNNLPVFRGGVALGPYLEHIFKIPVFINNDGNLFAYGEALAGILPQLNQDLKNAGIAKQYKNLIGLTLGTGFGAGLVFDNHMLIGDNSLAAEVWITSNRSKPEFNSEEIVSTRAIIRTYKKMVNDENLDLMPHDIYKIAKGEEPGYKEAAIHAFECFGKGIGDAIANLISLFDGVVVLGGGITGAKEFYMPGVWAALNEPFNAVDKKLNRIVQKVYCYDEESEIKNFLQQKIVKLTIPESEKSISYNPEARVIIAHSKLGANKATQLGAYVFALNKLDV